MPDKTEIIGRSLIHHGPENNRAYLMSLGDEDLADVIKNLDALATDHNYSKIIAKVPAFHRSAFEAHGYQVEAEVPGFYPGENDGIFAAKYLDANRRNDFHSRTCGEILRTAKAKRKASPDSRLAPGFAVRPATESDAQEMARLYGQVFASYPSPIHEESYIIKTMQENLHYYGVWFRGRLAGLASIEHAAQYANAEMTDFAVDKSFRGQRLALHLLGIMETACREMGILTAYSIARARSPGMNTTFARLGYEYGGTLINNTNIAGQIESMNVWYKSLQPPRV